MSQGEFRFQRERYLLRGKSILEEAWLLYQAIENDFIKDDEKQQSGQGKKYTPLLTSQEISTLNQCIQNCEFERVRQAMKKYSTKPLDNDPDCSLTLKALNCYQEQIKQRFVSIEGLLLTKHINYIMWNDMRVPRDELFKLPIKIAIMSEMDSEVERINKKIQSREQAANPALLSKTKSHQQQHPQQNDQQSNETATNNLKQKQLRKLQDTVN